MHAAAAKVAHALVEIRKHKISIKSVSHYNDVLLSMDSVVVWPRPFFFFLLPSNNNGSITPIQNRTTYNTDYMHKFCDFTETWTKKKLQFYLHLRNAITLKLGKEFFIYKIKTSTNSFQSLMENFTKIKSESEQSATKWVAINKGKVPSKL